MNFMSKTFVYIGTYTRSVPSNTDPVGKGIYVYELDMQTGALTPLSETHGIDDPSYLAIDPAGRHLYAVSEVGGWDEGLCSAYAINRETGALTYINKQPTLGSISAQVSVDHNSRCVLVTNYWAGNGVLMFSIREDGGIAPATSAFQHQGSGPVQGRQESSHAHCVLADPTNTYAYVADLGTDQLVCYKLDLGAGKLIPHEAGTVTLPSGTGPRHFVFHPNGKFAYLIGELSSTVTVFTYDSANGTMREIQTISALPEGYTGNNDCSAIQITPDGSYLYGANRGHDSIVGYAVDAQTGKLTLVGHQSTLGKWPRDFNIDPTGTFLLAANQHSNTVVTFRIDRSTGNLQETGIVTNMPIPVCVKFLTV
jgi:6-phosphogluconolactonase